MNNLKNRIERLEDVLSNEHKDTCECYLKHLFSVMESVYNSKEKAKVFPCPDLTKKTCKRCKKPISQSDKELAENIELIYG